MYDAIGWCVAALAWAAILWLAIQATVHGSGR